MPYPQGDPQEVLALPLLVEAFVQGASLDDEQDPGKRLRKGNLHFLASVFANISVVSVFFDAVLCCLIWIIVLESSRAHVLSDSPFSRSV